MHLNRVNAALTGNRESWAFVGHQGWQEDHEGCSYPPVWSYPGFDPEPDRVPDLYAHELAREDYAFLASAAFDDTDVSVDFKCAYGSVLHGGIVFRAVDSVRGYVFDVNDLGRKAQVYELTLWVQDASGVGHDGHGGDGGREGPDRHARRIPRSGPRARGSSASPPTGRRRVRTTAGADWTGVTPP